jgi:flavodoxin
MNVLIVYDSVYENTEKIAKAIASGIKGEASVVKAGEADVAEIASLDLLLVGSPTHGGRPTPAVKNFMNKIPDGGLKNIKVTAFDTRISGKDKGVGIKILVGVFGYAAGRIVDVLKSKGGTLAAMPEGFTVEDNEGPLAVGELGRAAKWGESLS